MAQRALGAGTAVPRKRALFGLLDADGWSWASVKAFLWLIIIIFILGYLPDRAYYLTVSSTVDLGVLVWSPINLCPPTNETLPCPAPAGAVVPWEPSPAQLALPQPRTDGSMLQVGTQILYLGGTDGKTAQSNVYVARTVGTGNFDAWAEGPPLPQPRADASVAYVAGSIYVIGGIDASGAPTDTVFVLSPDSQTGALGNWTTADNLKLPEGRAGSAIAITTDGLLIVGGRNAAGPVATTWRTRLNSGGKLGTWSAEQPMVYPQNDATAVLIGDYVWVYGGSDANGPVGAVQRGAFGLAAAEGLPPNPNAGKVIRWDVNNAANLPVARTNASGWGANGTLYLAGGNDGSGPKSEMYWAIPTTTGDLTEWKHLAATDLPASGLEGAPAVISGPNVILVGGETSGSTVLASSVRANTAPLPPFFQLGLVGATVPGMKIEGEIGQQLGYLNAALVGTVDFVLLILIGWAFAHKAQARAITGRVLRRGRRH
ncbi:MAG: Kelch repeat-containing protein [Acidimicrobiales bacterium]